MTTLHVGARSTVFVDDVGCVKRRYHDTGVETFVPVRLDANGTARIGGNRTLQSVTRDKFRGSARPLPPHLQRVFSFMFTTTSACEIASKCNVCESTIWTYLCRIVELCPDAASRAILYVSPSLTSAFESVDTTGPLRDVAARIGACNSYAQLRLLRLCQSSSLN